jgi:hypothetical protein
MTLINSLLRSRILEPEADLQPHLVVLNLPVRDRTAHLHQSNQSTFRSVWEARRTPFLMAWFTSSVDVPTISFIT